MEASILNQWFSGAQVNAICWTLIHSLWIGMIIALLCGIIIATTRKSTAVLRYRLLCGLLLLFVCAMGVTYYLEASTVPAYHVVGHAQNIVVKAGYSVVANPIVITQNQTLLDHVQGFLNQNTNIIFMAWLLLFALKSLKMISGLLYIQRIRNYKVSAVTEELKHRIDLLSSQIGIRRAVRLVQSGLVKVPVAVGWLKPMILLPIGIVFQLTTEQLDGILWHELAHIRRRDYLVNILQGLVETVFFFNPGLLWLSSLIRTEREACCDDMVLSRMNRKANYLEALLSFGYGEFSHARYAMSIGSGNQLRDRLKRMISQENKRLSIVEKSVLAVGLVLLTAFTTISKDSPIVKHLTVKYTNKLGKVVTKTVTVSMHRLPDGQRVADSKPGERAKDTIIVKDTVISFTSILFKDSDVDIANNDISAMDDKGNKYHFIVVDNKITVMELNGVKIAAEKLSDFQYLLPVIYREMAMKRRVRSEDMAAYKAKNPTAKFKRKDSVGYAGKRYGVDARSSDKVWAKMDNKQPHADVHVDGEWARDKKTESMRRRLQDDSISYDAQEQRVRSVIADLVNEKVVPGATAVKWFGLSNTEFIVNGHKQPDEMQQRYKAKYGVYDGYGLYYGPVQMHGRGVFIDTITAKERMQRLPLQPKAPRQPNYKGSIQPRYTNSVEWKNQQLVRQQQRFAADQAEKREKLIQQQQRFAANQNDKRIQLMQQQQAFLAGQNEKARQLWLKYDIDLQPAISGVITDLVSANVISDKSGLSSFSLSNKALIVNGKIQAEDIHEKLKSKYLGRSAYPGNGDVIDWDRIKNDPDFGLHFDTNGGQGLGIMAKRYSR